MKIVINKRYGGFGLSDRAYERMIELGVPVRKYEKEERGKDGLFKRVESNEGEVIFDRSLSIGESEFDTKESMKFMGRYWETWIGYNNRNHPLLVQVVEELGKKSWGQHAELKVVEVPDNVEWSIDEYDGIESIHEEHRTWG